jgi:hypothetical protein
MVKTDHPFSPLKNNSGISSLHTQRTAKNALEKEKAIKL